MQVALRRLAAVILFAVYVGGVTFAVFAADDITSPLRAETVSPSPEDIKALVLPGPDQYDRQLDEGIVDWIVVLRCEPAHDEPEFKVSIVKRHDGRVEASVVEITGSSLTQQVQSLVAASPATTAEDIAKLVQRRSWVVAGSESRELIRCARAFEGLSLRLRRSIGMSMDLTRYRFWSRTQSEQVTAELGVASSGDTSDPVVKWMQKVARAVGIRGRTR